MARFLNGLVVAPVASTVIIFRAVLLPSNVNPSTRMISSLASAVASGTIEIRAPLPVTVVMLLPAPIRFTPLVKINGLDHVEDPAGTATVSPLPAVATALATLEKLELAAVTVPALAERIFEAQIIEIPRKATPPFRHLLEKDNLTANRIRSIWATLL